MIFPKTDRVIYDVNPLAEVICQLRFSPILDIAAKPPADFQNLIRADYPEYEERRGVLRPDGDVPQEVVSAVEALMKSVATDREVAHDFTSSDGEWTVGLTQTFLALTTTNYERWERFEERLLQAAEALKVYNVPYFTRIGLRYRDLIKRSDLGLDGVPWRELLTPQISGELSAAEISDSDIIELRRQLRFKAEDALQVHLQHGLVRKKNDPEALFLFDVDIYSEERIDAQQRERLLSHLRDANSLARDIFRWAVQPRLHEALGPRPA